MHLLRPSVCVSVCLYSVKLKGLTPPVCRWKEHLGVSAGDCGAAHKCTRGETFISFHIQMYFVPTQQLIWCARLYRTWPWSMRLPPTPLPSLQRSILIRILTWATETSAGPLNWAFEHRSEEGSPAAINTSYSRTQSCEFSVWKYPLVDGFCRHVFCQVQRDIVDERGTSPVPGGAGDPHHWPHGSNEFPFCTSAGLCNPEISSWISC